MMVSQQPEANITEMAASIHGAIEKTTSII